MSEHRFYDSNHQLGELVRDRLARQTCFYGRNLQVEMQNDQVVLKGRVGSYYEKQLAQESVRSISGVTSIKNELEVVSVGKPLLLPS
jgi:osmotically-inducible protein OsmY